MWLELLVLSAAADTPYVPHPMEHYPGSSPGAPAAPAPSDPARGTPAGLVRIEVRGDDIGGTRSAFVHVPSGPGPWPVIVAYHGGRNNSGLEMEPRFHDRHDQNILFVYPNGLSPPGGTGTGWVGPEHAAIVDPMRDVNFARALIAELDRRYDIDRSRVYATGFSNGAYATDLLWCHASDLFHGFFVVSRAMPVAMSQQCPASPPRPYALMLGTADDGLHNAYQMSFPDSLAFVRRQLACDPDPAVVTLPDRGDRTTVTRSTWSGCAKGAAFEYFEIAGGGHHWPGHGKPVDDKSRDVDATDEVLKFFREHGGL